MSMLSLRDGLAASIFWVVWGVARVGAFLEYWNHYRVLGSWGFGELIPNCLCKIVSTDLIQAHPSFNGPRCGVCVCMFVCLVEIMLTSLY